MAHLKKKLFWEADRPEDEQPKLTAEYLADVCERFKSVTAVVGVDVTSHDAKREYAEL